MNKPWQDYSLVAFDTETSGAYPVGNDVVEFGAVKWSQGKEIDHLQFLVKPRLPMSDFIISIHGITNDMVSDAPEMENVVGQIRDFLNGSVLMAHHAPFDMGFLAWDFQRFFVTYPNSPVLCTSLLARQLIHGVENHKLQTLVKHFGFEGGAAHRALDDARACLQLGLKCLELLGDGATLEKAIKKQGKDLSWLRYSLTAGDNLFFPAVIEAIQAGRDLQIVYGGEKELRSIKPLGIVRNPDGDFLAAICGRDQQNKRFYFNRIKDLG